MIPQKNDMADAEYPTTDFSGPLSRLEIDLDAVAANYLLLKKKVAAGTDVAAVVKADAYGLGDIAVAQTLFAQNCRHFFAGHAEESFALRHALPSPDAVIYALNGLYGAAPRDIAHHGITPVLNTLDDVRAWAAFQQQSGQIFPAALHIDTGMNRLGMTVRETEHLANDKSLLAALRLSCVMSHLACADEPGHAKNEEQLKVFRRLCAGFNRPLRLSLANSAGVMLGSDYHFDLVRPGCALYGINPVPGQPNAFKNPVSWQGRIIQIRPIDEAGTVGYGATYAIKPPALCATISVGYADGYLRSLSDHGVVFINGESCPVIGRVSMDLIVADVSHVTTPVTAGGWADIIGAHQAADDVAKAAGTIGYEILTSLGRRIKKTYKKNI